LSKKALMQRTPKATFKNIRSSRFAQNSTLFLLPLSNRELPTHITAAGGLTTFRRYRVARELLLRPGFPFPTATVVVLLNKLGGRKPDEFFERFVEGRLRAKTRLKGNPQDAVVRKSRIEQQPFALLHPVAIDKPVKVFSEPFIQDLG